MKFVLSGPPFSGKTTTLCQLALVLPKFYMVPESAISLIELLNQNCGLEAFRKWRNQYNRAWQDLVITRQLLLEKQADQVSASGMFETIGIDSTPIDSYAFALAYPSPEIPLTELEILCRSCYYDKVFYLELVEPFDPRTNTGRLQTREDALRIGRHQFESYSKFGMTPIRVPFMPMKDRIEFITEQLV